MTAKFIVELTGAGYAIPSADPAAEVAGFVVTCCVEAAGPDAACALAVQTLFDSTPFREEIAPHADPGTSGVEVSYLAEVGSFDGRQVPLSAFVFFGPDSAEGPQGGPSQWPQ